MRLYLKAINSFVPVLLAALILVGCGEFEKPKEVSLAMLTENATNFDNNQVITRGIVRRFEAPLHYWIEDEDLNRVEIFPQERVALYLGEAVLVEGHFRFSATEGRRLALARSERGSKGKIGKTLLASSKAQSHGELAYFVLTRSQAFMRHIHNYVCPTVL